MRVLPSSLLFLLFAYVRAGDTDEYHERLDLRPLPDGKLSSNFRFSTTAELRGEQWGDNVELYTSRLFPRSIASVIRAHGVAELHLSLAAGRWEYDRWGWPANNGSATGAEVWAWLERREEDVDKQWSALANTLGGLFCTSLNRLDHSHTTSPSLTFQPQGAIDADGFRALRRGLLPLEKPCTENLTPFVALLPCRSAAGLAQLLKPHRFFDSDWQRLSVNLIKLADGRHQLDLDVEIVFDPARLDRGKGGPGRRDWSFESLFERTISKNCPAATRSSDIVLHLTDSGTEQAVAESESWGRLTKPGSSGQQLPQAMLVRTGSFPLNAELKYGREAVFEYPEFYEGSPVSISRTYAGFGHERGAIGVEVLNAGPEAVEAVYVEEWPWWLKAYLHTLRERVEPLDLDTMDARNSSSGSSVIASLRYTPAQDRKRPTLLEAHILLPPRSRVTLSLDYDKAFLRYTEYAPDANRGFDVPAASLHLLKAQKRVYTTSGLISMPTPDFSMPYNVCILTSTAVALFWGSTFNGIVRKFVLVRLGLEKTDVSAAK